MPDHELTFVCECCDVERAVHLSMVTPHDLSADFDIPRGRLIRMVRHCRDRGECIDLADDVQNWRLASDEDEAAAAVWGIADREAEPAEFADAEDLPSIDYRADERPDLPDPWAFAMEESDA